MLAETISEPCGSAKGNTVSLEWSCPKLYYTSRTLACPRPTLPMSISLTVRTDHGSFSLRPRYIDLPPSPPPYTISHTFSIFFPPRTTLFTNTSLISTLDLKGILRFRSSVFCTYVVFARFFNISFILIFSPFKLFLGICS